MVSCYRAVDARAKDGIVEGGGKVGESVGWRQGLRIWGWDETAQGEAGRNMVAVAFAVGRAVEEDDACV